MGSSKERVFWERERGRESEGEEDHKEELRGREKDGEKGMK